VCGSGVAGPRDTCSRLARRSFLISTHYTRYNPWLFALNFVATVFVLLPKLPIVSAPPGLCCVNGASCLAPHDSCTVCASSSSRTRHTPAGPARPRSRAPTVPQAGAEGGRARRGATRQTLRYACSDGWLARSTGRPAEVRLAWCPTPALALLDDMPVSLLLVCSRQTLCILQLNDAVQRVCVEGVGNACGTKPAAHDAAGRRSSLEVCV